MKAFREEFVERRKTGHTILAALDAGKAVKEIAAEVGCSVYCVYSAKWSRDNPKKRKKINRTAGKNRYRTEAYRKRNRDYARLRYHADPDFRRARLDAVARSRYNRRQSDDREGRQTDAGSHA